MENISGAKLIDLTEHADDRGSFTEVFRNDWGPQGALDVEWPQANLSRSRAGVLRGMHFHRRQADYWVLAAGTYRVALFDLREDSPTFRQKDEFDLSARDPRGLYIPTGVAHGFQALTDVLMFYLVDQLYDGSDEFGIAWDDPDMDLRWPWKALILSERDQKNPSLAEVLKTGWRG